MRHTLAPRALALVITLAVSGCAGSPATFPSLPTAAGPAPSPKATIHRDAWGAPHVLSDTDEGALYGMAWALAEDDWVLMEENYLHALGRYAEVAGETGLHDDWMARTLRIVPLSVAEYQRASPRMRGLLDAFAAGLNAWLAAQPASELRVLRRVESWYPVALIRYKYYQNEYLGYAGLRDEWARRLFEGGLTGDGVSVGVSASDSGRVGAVDGKVDPPRYWAAQFDGLGFRPRGSNEWALAGSRTASGNAMLLINPHQSFVGVQRYAEIHVDSREGLRFSGLTVFGFLLPYMGNNETLGWAYTDNYADHSDLWAEAFDQPSDPLAYRHGDEWRTAQTWTDTVRVRTDRGVEPRVLRHWATHHGPIVGIDDVGRPLAVRMAGYEEGGWYDQWLAMIDARSLDEWRAGLAGLRVAYMNTMYADRDGNIGYVYNSRVPRRKPGVDPSGVLDGRDPDTEWQGFHTLDELPQVWNPGTGWLTNTNSTPFTATTGLEMTRDDFPAYMVGGETDNMRAVSSRRVLQAMDDVSLDDFAAAVWDSRLSLADQVIQRLTGEWAARDADGGSSGRADADPGADPLADAVARLAAWDRTADTASVETTWFTLMMENRGDTLEVAGDSTLLGALDATLRMLLDTWGTYEVPWGRINRHQRPLPGDEPVLDPGRPSLAIGGAHGGYGSVFSYYSHPTDDSAGPRIGRGGNSFVKVIEFAPEGPRARSILNYGQSGDPASPHWFDQAELYAERRFKPAWWSRADVEANSVRVEIVGGGH